MSTMKVTNLKHESSSVNNVVLNADGSVGGELGSALASKLPYSYGTATPSTTDSGFLWYDSNSTPAAPKFWDGAAFQALTSGKILQIVRATDSTQRTTTSTTFVDVTGMSVTITPQKSDSAVIVLASFQSRISNSNGSAYYQIADSSNNAVSGAENGLLYSFSGSTLYVPLVLFGYATPATTSAVTYKLRFKTDSGFTAYVDNVVRTGQLFAIEVSA